MTTESPSHAADELFALQVAQLKHDEKYHREIARLTVHARLNHMALHFCKYVGQLAKAVRDNNKLLVRRVVTDSFVIGLSSANVLNLKLATVIPDAQEAASLSELGKILLRKTDAVVNGDGDWLFLKYAIEVGQMARACEKLDHLEPYPFREKIAEAVGAICQTSLIAARIYEFDLVRSIKARFAEIEPKYLFHDVP